MITTDMLIPPNSDLSHALLQLAESLDLSTWEIANITNDLIDELVGTYSQDGDRVTMRDVYKAVAIRCKGAKYNTIRRWAECARDYPPEVQEQYSVLSFEHFKVARRLEAHGLVPSKEYALEWCVSGEDMKVTAGRIKTAGELLKEFDPDFRDDGIRAYWSGVRENLLDKITAIHVEEYRQKALEAYRVLDTILNELEDTDANLYRETELE